LDYSTKSGDGLRFPPVALEDAWQELNKEDTKKAKEFAASVDLKDAMTKVRVRAIVD
jgi:hypothetical protein